MRRLTTTSHALLGLLSITERTAYELTQQMHGTLGFIWPRAQSGIYAEPSSLVEHGLATSRAERAGRRRRTVYSISRSGRDALARWLQEEPTPSTFESEASLKLIFSDTKSDLLAAVDAVDRDARAKNQQLHEAFVGDGDDVGGLRCAGRMHVNGVAARLYHEHYAATRRWARWARAEIEDWPTTDADAARLGEAIVEDNRRRYRGGRRGS